VSEGKNHEESERLEGQSSDTVGSEDDCAQEKQSPDSLPGEDLESQN
jgi:hypothetical protein